MNEEEQREQIKQLHEYAFSPGISEERMNIHEKAVAYDLFHEKFILSISSGGIVVLLYSLKEFTALGSIKLWMFLIAGGLFLLSMMLYFIAVISDKLSINKESEDLINFTVEMFLEKTKGVVRSREENERKLEKQKRRKMKAWIFYLIRIFILFSAICFTSWTIIEHILQKN